CQARLLLTFGGRPLIDLDGNWSLLTLWYVHHLFPPARSEMCTFSNCFRTSSAACLQIASSLRFTGLLPSSSLKGLSPVSGPSTASTTSRSVICDAGRARR